MCVREFACQSRSSATVCVCPVVVQCYCSMEPTPTSATPTASPPWTWLNPPQRPCSQVSVLSVILSVKCHAHRSVFLSTAGILLHIASVCYTFPVLNLFAFSIFLHFQFCLNVNMLSTPPNISSFFSQGCRQYLLFFPPVNLSPCVFVMLCRSSTHYACYSVYVSKAIHTLATTTYFAFHHPRL